jgi:hypothetical protein
VHFVQEPIYYNFLLIIFCLIAVSFFSDTSKSVVQQIKKYWLKVIRSYILLLRNIRMHQEYRNFLILELKYNKCYYFFFVLIVFIVIALLIIVPFFIVRDLYLFYQLFYLISSCCSYVITYLYIFNFMYILITIYIFRVYIK